MMLFWTTEELTKALFTGALKAMLFVVVFFGDGRWDAPYWFIAPEVGDDKLESRWVSQLRTNNAT